MEKLWTYFSFVAIIVNIIFAWFVLRCLVVMFVALSDISYQSSYVEKLYFLSLAISEYISICGILTTVLLFNSNERGRKKFPFHCFHFKKIEMYYHHKNCGIFLVFIV